MIWFAFRRMAGGRRQPPPNNYRGVGPVLILLVLVAVASMNWRVTFIVLGVLAGLTVLLCMAGRAQGTSRKRDPLDEAMREYGKGGKP